MTVLSLLEAAERAATSKVDVWRAIRDGALPARKTSDGYAIDQTDLFRVFERKQPESDPALPEPSPASDRAPDANIDEGSERAAALDISIAFAALQAELKSLLGARGEATPAERRGEPGSGPEPEQDCPQPADSAAGRTEPGPAVAERAALAPCGPEPAGSGGGGG